MTLHQETIHMPPANPGEWVAAQNMSRPPDEIVESTDKLIAAQQEQGMTHPAEIGFDKAAVEAYRGQTAVSHAATLETVVPLDISAEQGRAERSYNAFLTRWENMREKNPELRLRSPKTRPTIEVTADTIPAMEAVAGIYHKHEDKVTMASGFSERTTSHEGTHRELGIFGVDMENDLTPFNEGLTQIFTRAVNNNGEIILQPPTENEVYVADQQSIAMICERSGGKIGIVDFVIVCQAPGAEKRIAFVELMGKMDEAYPGAANILTESMQLWITTSMGIVRDLPPELQEYKSLMTVIIREAASNQMRDYIDQRTKIYTTDQ